MSAKLVEEQRTFNQERFRVSHFAIEPKARREPSQRKPLSPVTDNEEMKFVAKAVIWMIVLGTAPLILFHIINFFYPDFLWIPVAQHPLQ